MGPLELIIVLAIALVVFGGYFRKQLPQFGRTAGKQARIGGEKAKVLAEGATAKGSEVGGKVGEKVGGRFDAGDMGRTAGKHVREARELRDSFKGTLSPTAEGAPKPGTDAASQRSSPPSSGGEAEPERPTAPPEPAGKGEEPEPPREADSHPAPDRAG